MRSGLRGLLRQVAVLCLALQALPLAAGRFVSWMNSAEARQLIAGFRVGGQQVFFLPAKVR